MNNRLNRLAAVAGILSLFITIFALIRDVFDYKVALPSPSQRPLSKDQPSQFDASSRKPLQAIPNASTVLPKPPQSKPEIVDFLSDPQFQKSFQNSVNLVSAIGKLQAKLAHQATPNASTVMPKPPQSVDSEFIRQIEQITKPASVCSSQLSPALPHHTSIATCQGGT
jgi:hypothetical protein